MAKRKTRKERIRDIILFIYRESYRLATPSADFDELLANAPIADDGKKTIPYNDYEIDGNLFDAIVEDAMTIDTKLKLTKQERLSIRFEAYLGATPSIKKSSERKIKIEEKVLTNSESKH